MYRYRNSLAVIVSLMMLLFAYGALGQQKLNDALIKKYRQIKGKDSAENYARELISLAKKNHDVLFEARVLYAQSMKVYKGGDEARALEIAYKANKLTSVSDSVTYTRTATMIAYLLSRRGKNVEALNAAFDILKQTEAKGWKKLSIECLNCVADLYRSMDDPKKALPYAQQASAEALSLKDTAMYTLSLSTLSNLYSAKPLQSPANLMKAANYLETLLKAPYLATLSAFTRAQYLSNLGRIYIIQKRFKDAETALTASLTISREGKFVSLQKHALNELMTNEIELGHYRDAIKYGQLALAIQADAQSSRMQVRDIYYQFTRAYIGLNDYKQAFDYSQKQSMIDDSLNAVDKNKAATELDAKYKADKRLIIATDSQRLALQQRNFIIVIAILAVLAIIAAYRWFLYKNKKEAALLSEQHKQLARLDAMKTRFFANISHELRTPLTLIMGPAEQLMSKPGMDDQLQGYLQTVLRNSSKLLNMVNEMLDLGKIEAGTIKLKLKTVDLSRFINIIFQGFASAAEYKKISFTLNNAIPNGELVRLDADKFEKIANNLIGNAIKFTPGNGAVSVNCSLNDDSIVFEVTDNGNGIAPDDLPFLFDRYFQGNNQQMPLDGGTGIGLAIAKEFAELMQGQITIKSTPGNGATFTVTIPKIAAEPGTYAEYGAPLEETIAKPAGQDAEKLVMLVEDHQEMSEYISSIIKPFYNIVIAHNGVEALNMLKAMPKLPDLVISDVMMPEMDGFTLLAHLKSSPVFCLVPVIMLTALADNENKLKALNTGVDDYLTKPFISNELLTRTRNLIANAANRMLFSSQDEAELAELKLTDPDSKEKEIETNAPTVSPADLHWLAELEAMVRKHTGKTDLSLAMLSDELAISERQLFRRIKSITGLTPNKYIRVIRLQIAREGIQSGRYRTIAEISYVAGFDTPAYFSKLFKEHFGRDVNDLLWLRIGKPHLFSTF